MYLDININNLFFVYFFIYINHQANTFLFVYARKYISKNADLLYVYIFTQINLETKI